MLAMLLVSNAPQTASAQLIAYEGFDYETGNLGLDVANGALGTGTGWEPNLGWVNTNDKPDPVGDATAVENPVDWGYTDSQGNSLPTSGRDFQQTGWTQLPPARAGGFGNFVSSRLKSFTHEEATFVGWEVLSAD